METLRESMQRLTRKGYHDQFRAAGDRLHARDAKRAYAPESLVVDEVVRFEGVSDPADESALFALRSIADDVRGTYTVAYGPDMDVADARIVSRLRTADRD